MKFNKHSVILVLLFFFGSISAQHAPGSPTYHRGFGGAALYLQGGYQHQIHSTDIFNTYTASAEVKYDGYIAWNRMSLTMNEEYVSFNPFSIISFLPLLRMIVLEDGIHTYDVEGGKYTAPRIIILMMDIIAYSSQQYKFSLSDHIELTTGWEYLKLTKIKKYWDNYFLTGSVNAGLTAFLGDNLFITGFYEYNYTHNTAIKVINWIIETGKLGHIDSQPDLLKGHTCGVRLGWMF